MMVCFGLTCCVADLQASTADIYTSFSLYINAFSAHHRIAHACNMRGKPFTNRELFRVAWDAPHIALFPKVTIAKRV